MPDTSVGLSSRKTVSSEIQSEVSYEIYVMTEKRRRELRSKCAPLWSEVRKNQNELDKVQRQREELMLLEKPTEETTNSLHALTQRAGELAERLNEILDVDIIDIYVEWGLCQIKGLVIDGNEITMKDSHDIPSSLYMEIYTLCADEAKLSQEDAKNSKPSTTSKSPELTNSSRTTATSADSVDSSLIATAAGTSLN